MSDGLHGHGTTLAIADGTNSTAIGNITTINGPNQSRDPIDISTMDSASKFREFLPGMLDAGELTAELNYDGAASGTGDDLNTLYKSTATNLVMTIEFNDNGTSTGSTFACVGFVTGLGFAIPYDDKVSQSVSLKLSGIPTFTDLA